MRHRESVIRETNQFRLRPKTVARVGLLSVGEASSSFQNSLSTWFAFSESEPPPTQPSAMHESQFVELRALPLPEAFQPDGKR